MQSNSIPICRSILDNWIYKDAEYFKAWFEMLARARYNYEPKTDIYNNVVYTINRSEFIFGYPSWSSRLGIGQRKLRTLIKHLLADNMVTLIKKYGKFTVYSIVKYDDYNTQNNNQGDNQECIDNTGAEDDSRQTADKVKSAKYEKSDKQNDKQSDNLNDKHKDIDNTSLKGTADKQSDNLNDKQSDKQPTSSRQLIKKDKEGIKNVKEDILSAEQTPYEQIMDLFNTVCITLPHIKSIKDNRRKVISSRWKGNPDIEYFNNLFISVNRSNFLSGRDGKWMACCFDWIFKPANTQKIIEGNYENKASVKIDRVNPKCKIV